MDNTFSVDVFYPMSLGLFKTLQAPALNTLCLGEGVGSIPIPCLPFELMPLFNIWFYKGRTLDHAPHPDTLTLFDVTSVLWSFKKKKILVPVLCFIFVNITTDSKWYGGDSLETSIFIIATLNTMRRLKLVLKTFQTCFLRNFTEFPNRGFDAVCLFQPSHLWAKKSFILVVEKS